jgi:choline dehydrogenase-like flavoprotein
VEHWLAGSRSTRVLADTEVIGVNVSSGQVRGVVVRNGSERPAEIACTSVVLAAGTIESTRLALQALTATDPGARPVADGLTDHIVHGFVAPLDPAGLPAWVVEQAAREAFFVAPLTEARSNLFVRLYPNRLGAVILDAWAMGEQLPSAEGRIECVPDGDWPWQVRISTGLCAADHAVIDAQHQALRGFWREFCAITGRPASDMSGLEFADFLRPPRTLHGVVPTIDDLPAGQAPVTWSSPLGSEYHEACTLALGRMLDDDHRFPAVEGLYAAGPATFSRPGAANPSLTSLALARRLAGLLDR